MAETAPVIHEDALPGHETFLPFDVNDDRMPGTNR